MASPFSAWRLVDDYSIPDTWQHTELPPGPMNLSCKVAPLPGWKIVRRNSGGVVGLYWHLVYLPSCGHKEYIRQWQGERHGMLWRAICGGGCEVGALRIRYPPGTIPRQGFCRECVRLMASYPGVRAIDVPILWHPNKQGTHH